MLIFPEVCEKEELEDLEAMAEPIERFFDNRKLSSLSGLVLEMLWVDCVLNSQVQSDIC